MKTVLATLALAVEGNKVLLAEKMSGWRKGIFNGIGGKVDPGETIDAAMIRETQEESLITPTEFKKVGIINFELFNRSGEPEVMIVHAYLVTKWQGEPKETTEMRPVWFDKTSLPFDNMWDSDKKFIPLLLANKKIIGNIKFDKDYKEISYEVKEVKAFNKAQRQ